MNTHYTTPDAELVSSENSKEYCEIKFLSVNCRIGRIRYLAHLMLFYFLFIIAMALFTALGTIGVVFAVILYIVGTILSIIAGVQRLHDLDKSGWWLLVGIIPIVNLLLGIYMLFFSGSEEHNRYGAPPPPNKTWHCILAVIMPLVAIIGIAASVIIPMLASG